MSVSRAFSGHTPRGVDRRAAFVCALFVLASAACGGSASTSTTGAGPTALKCGVALRASATTFGYGGGSGQIEIDTARECEWNGSSDARWISLKPASGQGGATIQFSVAANEQPTRRAAGILVNDRRVDLSQEPAPCNVQLAAARTLGFDGGDSVISVATLNGCRWTATTSTSWIELREPVSGSGNGEVRFHVPPNGGAERTGAIRVAGSEQSIVQQAAPGPSIPPAPPAPVPPAPPAPGPPAPSPPPPAPPPTCGLELDHVSGDAAAAGGDGRIGVRAPAACSWTAVSRDGWITITAGAGKGNGEVRYRVAPNTDQRPRTASIAVGDRSFIVRQEAAPPPAPPPTTQSCSFDVDPKSEKFDEDGGEDRIRVRSTDTCAWSALSQSGWIEITSGRTGKGDGEARYRVAANTGPAREGTLSVADEIIKIRQDGVSQRKVEIEGKIGSLQGACPKVTFSVDGTAVQTTGDTDYDHGSCSSLRNGVKVKVKGLQSSNGGTVLALEVKVKDDDDE